MLNGAWYSDGKQITNKQEETEEATMKVSKRVSTYNYGSVPIRENEPVVYIQTKLYKLADSERLRPIS